MKRPLFILLSILLFSCSTQKSITTQSNTDARHDTQTEKVYQTITRDSVVIRDSVVLRADGSVSTFHKEKDTKIQLQNMYWYIRERIAINKTIVKTIRVTVTKYVHDFVWYTGLAAYLFVIIFLIYKLKNKFTL